MLLATFNGGRYLDAQLASVAAQDFGFVDLYVSDDGSTDHTGELLTRWRDSWRKGRFEIARGPAKGFAENFRFLIGLPTGEATHVAFCDQDDIWDTDKLGAAIAALERAGTTPGLYCARTRLVDSSGEKVIGLSPEFRRPPHFRNAIVQSIAGGNTMVLNRAGFDLVAQASRRTGFVSHDWWAYQLVSGGGGYVYYDAVPHVAYRQHGANAVGNNLGLLAKLKRLRMTLAGTFSSWNATNLESLERCAELLTDESRQTLIAFKAAREAPILERIAALRRSGIYRQTAGGDFSLAVAALLGKL